MARPTPLTDDDLRAITDAEMRQAIGYWSGKLANQREKALVYYQGEARLDLTPPEIEGRSSVVSTDVRNVIESMLPQLMVRFAGGETVVEFEPTKPGDEQRAQQATDYVNYLYNVRNNGEAVTYVWMKDALLSKRGFLKVWWDERSEDKREEYRGLSDVELAQLMEDDEVEVLEQRSYPDEDDARDRQKALEDLQKQLDGALNAVQQARQANPQAAQQAGQQADAVQQRMAEIQGMPPKMLFDVACKRSRKGGRVRVENVPPEEFLISRRAKSIEDAPFVGHRVARTISELRSMGYQDLDDLAGDENATALNMERVTRLAYDDELAYLQVDEAITMDPSQRTVWVTECYVRVDYDGDGISELRKVVRAGNKILENEIVDCAPFVSICPVPMPHKFFGMSVADLAMESQKTKTALLRAALDNTYLQVNGRYFAVDGQVNLDDLLSSRPGGIVRTRAPGMVGRLDQGAGDLNAGMSMLEYMQGYLEDSTGWTRYNAGLDGDSLNQTATGINNLTNRADMRLDLIARNFAEGFRDLFRLILKLVSQYQSSEDIIRLRGSFVPVNPREWRNQFDTTINVGLGTGNKDQQVAHLSLLMQQQQFGLSVGTAQAANVYEAQSELVRALGFKTPERFFTDPRKQQLPAPPNPAAEAEQIKAQATLQAKQMELQAAAQREQAKLQQEMERIRLDNEAKMRELQANLELQASNDQRDAQREQMKMQLDAQLRQQEQELQRWKAQLDANVAIYLEKLKQGLVPLDQPIGPADLAP